MGVIGGDQRKLAAFGQKQVGNGGAVRSVTAGGAAVVVDLDCVGGGDAARIGQGQAGPLRVGDGDESPGRHRAGGDFGSGFLTQVRQEVRAVRGFEVRRQADGQDMPKLAVLHHAGMQFRPQDGGEAVGPERHGVHDRIAISADEMVGQGQEVIALGPVAAADFFGGQHPVRAGGMGMDIPTPEAAGGGKGKGASHARQGPFAAERVIFRGFSQQSWQRPLH